MAHWHDFNPWANRIVYVPSLEELASCLMYSDNVNEIIRGWQTNGKKFDAYILPQPDGRHSIGIRYGKRPEDYISPYGDPTKIQVLLEKYQNPGA